MRATKIVTILLLALCPAICAVQAAESGSLLAWGSNSDGQTNVPDGNDFIAIAAGWYYGLGLKSDGSIVAWGKNDHGQCNVPSPNNGFIAIAAGGHYGLGLKSDGSIVAWGRNDYGQCNVPSPNNGFIAIAAGAYHSLGLKSDGSIVAWGYNVDGQCNVPLPNIGFIAIAAGWYHSLGLKNDGSIVAWGNNSYGQSNVPSPNNGFITIAAGGFNSLGLKSDGSIVAWGWNLHGQCNVPSPNTGFINVAAGGFHSLGLKNDDSIVAWGRNDYGQCNVHLPNTGFRAITGGEFHSLAIKASGAQTGCNCSGTANYITKFTDETTIGNSVIYENDGNVGIGTESPQKLLDIFSSSYTNLGIRLSTGLLGGTSWEIDNDQADFKIIENIALPGYPKTRLILQSGTGNIGIGTTSPNRQLTIYADSSAFQNVKDGTHELLMGVDGFGGIVSVYTDHDLIFRAGKNSEKMRIKAGGNVGIGTNSPKQKLDVSQGNIVLSEPNSTMHYISLHRNNVEVGSLSTANGRITVSAASGFDAMVQNSSAAGIIVKNSSGNVGIGMTDPSEKLDVIGTARLRGLTTGSGTTIVADGNGKLYKQSSSRRYKTNIQNLEDDADKVLELRPVRFQWKTTGQKEIGLISEEVEAVAKDLVIYDQEGKPDAVKYDKVALYLLSVIKTQQQRITALEAKQDENRSLAQRIEALEKMLGQQKLTIKEVQK
jgi:hypothetical protein